MKKSIALDVFDSWDRKGRAVFTTSDLKKIFPREKDKTFSEGLRRLVHNGLLTRAANGVYVYTRARSKGSDIILKVAKALRRGFYSYVSLESALSEHGVISQIPTSRVTIMTTGRCGVFKTPFGVIEFTHTKRSPVDILNGTIDREQPLRFARAYTAAVDLANVKRNTHLISRSELKMVMADGQ